MPQQDQTGVLSSRSSMSSVDLYSWNTYYQLPDLRLTSPELRPQQGPLRPQQISQQPQEQQEQQEKQEHQQQDHPPPRQHTPPPNTEPLRDSMLTDPESVVKEEEMEWKPRKEEYLVMGTLATISLMVAFDATILVTVLPILAIDLHGTAAEAFWAGTSYLLTSAVFQPFIAALSDIFGRREAVLCSVFLFTMGSIICGCANSFSVLLGGRCVQGIGGGGVMCMAQVIYADIIPLRYRPKYFTFILLSWAFGTVFGPLLGALFGQKATWRLCFFINLPFCGTGLVLTFFYLKLTTEKTSLKSKLGRVDWIGGFLFITGLTCFLIAISWGGVEHPWRSFRTVVPLILGILSMLLSFLYEHFLAKEAFLTKALFYNAAAIAGYVCAVLQGMNLYICLYYLTFYYTSVLLRSPIGSAVDLLPAVCFSLPGSAVTSVLIGRLARFRWSLWAGWTISTLGSGLFLLLNANTHTAVWAVASSIFGIGMGMLISGVNFAVQATCRKSKDTGHAAAMYTFCRTLGMTLGVGIGGSVFQNVMAHDLTRRGLPTDIARLAEGYVATLRTLDPTDPLRAKVLHAYVQGFRGVFTLSCVICGIALLISLFIKHQSMERLLVSRYSLVKE